MFVSLGADRYGILTGTRTGENLLKLVHAGTGTAIFDVLTVNFWYIFYEINVSMFFCLRPADP